MDGLAETILQLVPDDDSAVPELWVDRIHVAMPLELYMRRRDGRWTLESSAPTQRIRTAVLPVFHRVALRVQARAEEAQSD
jgi:hypothetical protein